MDGDRVTGYRVGGWINLTVCDYISSIKKELLVY